MLRASDKTREITPYRPSFDGLDTVRAAPRAFHNTREKTSCMPSFNVPDAMRAVDLYKKAYGSIEEEYLGSGEMFKIVRSSQRVDSLRTFLDDPMFGRERGVVSKSTSYTYMYTLKTSTTSRT